MRRALAKRAKQAMPRASPMQLAAAQRAPQQAEASRGFQTEPSAKPDDTEPTIVQ